jgi:hypothetical protein
MRWGKFKYFMLQEISFKNLFSCKSNFEKKNLQSFSKVIFLAPSYRFWPNSLMQRNILIHSLEKIDIPFNCAPNAYKRRMIHGVKHDQTRLACLWWYLSLQMTLLIACGLAQCIHWYKWSICQGLLIWGFAWNNP